MFLIAVILVQAFIIASRQLWVLYVGSLGIGALFVGLELWELWRVRKKIVKCEPAEAKKQGQKVEPQEKNDMGRVSDEIGNAQIHKISMYESIITVASSKIMGIFKVSSLLLEYSHSGKPSCPSITGEEAKADRQKNTKQSKKQQEMDESEELFRLRVLYLGTLRTKVLREFGFLLFYAVFVGFVVGFRVGSEGWEIGQLAIKLAFRLSIPSLIYLIPMLLNSMWKLQRMYLHMLPPPPPEPTMNPLNLASEQIPTDTAQSIQLTLQILQLQSISQAFMLVYLLAHCLINIGFSFIFLLLAWAESLMLYFQLLGYSWAGGFYEGVTLLVQRFGAVFGEADAWGWAAFGANRTAVLVLGLMYVLLRDAESVGKPLGMRESVWKMHMTMDKLIKLLSNQLRKQYHRKIAKTLKKLQRHNLLTPTPARQHKSSFIEPQLSVYYQCL